MSSLEISTCTQVSRIAFVIVFVIVVTMYNYSLITASFRNRSAELADDDTTIYDIPPAGYLVWNDQCRIEDVNPFDPRIMTLFEWKNHTECSDESPLTEVLFDMNSRNYILRVNDLATKRLLGDDDNVSCCYQSISRSKAGSIDNDHKLMDCIPISGDYVVPLDVDGVIVTCKSVRNKRQRDAHSFVQEKSEVRKRIKSFEGKNKRARPISVLLMGIDGVSRIDLRTTLPETAYQLYEDNWFELGGYNKIDENAFSNLMALLTGCNMGTLSAKSLQSGVDDCNLIWNLFRKNGYATSYAEDEPRMNGFNYFFEGFKEPPVDYYLQPFMLSIDEHLPRHTQNNMTFCIGIRSAAEYIYDLALELATRYRSEPYFGLFLSNTFNYNAFGDPSSMDIRIAKYLDEMKKRGILEDSIVIFFSDHGTRYQKVNYLHQSLKDASLPFIFIWLPPWLRVKYPEYVKSLEVNRYRLTCPFDIHMTLRHILELSGRPGKLTRAEGCPNCQSLFFPVSPERSCKDIGIEDRWCTCTKYRNITTSHPTVIKAVQFMIREMNEYLKSKKILPPCYHLKLKSIDVAQMKVESDGADESDEKTYRIQFTVHAENARFEVNLLGADAGNAFDIIGRVARLDPYKATSGCILDKNAKKYCICNVRYLIMQAIHRYMDSLETQ